MKRFWALLIVAACCLAGIFYAGAYIVSGQEQQHIPGKPDSVERVPAPVVTRLNLEASRTFAAIDRAEDELKKQYAQLENQRLMLLVGAGVPQDARVCAQGADEIVVCTRPAPSPSPATKP